MSDGQPVAGAVVQGHDCLPELPRLTPRGRTRARPASALRVRQAAGRRPVERLGDEVLVESGEVGDLAVGTELCGMQLRDVAGARSQQIGGHLAGLDLQQPLEGDLEIGEPAACCVAFSLQAPQIGGPSGVKRCDAHPAHRVMGRSTSIPFPLPFPLRRVQRQSAPG